MEPKWEQYTSPGGENYSESVLTLPYTGRGSDYTHPQIQRKYADEITRLEANVEAAQQEKNKLLQESGNHGAKYKIDNRERYIQYLINNGLNRQNAKQVFEVSRPIDISQQLGEEQHYSDLYQAIRDSYRAAEDKAISANVEHDKLIKKMWEESEALHPEYTKEHFSHESHLGDIDNPLLHQRWKERVGPAGERILSNEELQSDWAQKGREEGFYDPAARRTRNELENKEREIYNRKSKEQSTLRNELNKVLLPIIDEIEGEKRNIRYDHMVKMTPEEEKEFTKLQRKVDYGDESLDDLEKKKFRYLNSKSYYADRGELNHKELINLKYNVDVHPFLEEATAKNKELDSNTSLSPAERGRLKDEVEAEYIQKVKHLDDQLEKDLAEYKQRSKRYEERMQELTKQKEEKLKPYYDDHRIKTDALDDKYDPELKAVEAELAKLPKAGNIPLVPHVGSTEQWTELGVKHALQHALEQGHDQIFIMGGQEQARRWQNALRQSVDNIRWEPSREREWPMLSSVMGEPPIPKDSFKTVYAKPKGDNFERQFVVDKNGVVLSSDIGQAEGQKLSAVVGSDLAKRIMKEESGDMPMENYIMGSEGYTQHYERKMPSVYKDIIKKYLKVDPKIEASSLRERKKIDTSDPSFLNELENHFENVSEEEKNELSRQMFDRDFSNLSVFQRDQVHGSLYDRAKANLRKEWSARPHNIKQGPHGTTVHITPEMKEAYKRIKQEKGAVFPGYKKGGTVQKALDIVRRGDAR